MCDIVCVFVCVGNGHQTMCWNMFSNSCLELVARGPVDAHKCYNTLTQTCCNIYIVANAKQYI